jgi:Domain of unknown function (DUF6321)
MIGFKEYLEEVTKPTGDLKKACWTGYTAVGTKQKNGKTVPNCVPEEVELEELFDILEEVVDGIAEENNIDPDILWENLEDVSDEELYETAAWRRKEGKSASGGLNRKGIMSYRRENPGSKLKMAVTGKVKPGSKAAKRRKSFCARMSGMKGPMKKPNGKPTRKALALRKWKCR